MTVVINVFYEGSDGAAENLARIQALKGNHGISDRVEKFLC